MNTLSSRHEGDLNGRLLPFAASRKLAVALLLDESAKFAPVQHSAWMLANMLIRFDGYVERVIISCPPGIPVQPEVFPLSGPDFKDALLTTLRSLQLLPVDMEGRGDVSFHMGPGAAPREGWRVYGDGWCGGVTQHAIDSIPGSVLPFGPYVAACFAASEVFKQARLRPADYESSAGFFDVWTHRSTSVFANAGPLSLPKAEIACTLAGVGAVGCSFLHVMASCPTILLRATLADNDVKGIDISNLNRYVLFGRDSLGKIKPDRAIEVLCRDHLRLTPWNDSIGSLTSFAERVVSAVDKNRARFEIQNRFPARIFSASTSELRAEVLRCGPPGEGACLRCHNPPETEASDAELVERLRGATADEFAKLCIEANVSAEDARAWILTQKCGQVGSALLTRLRSEESVGSFAVGFTSVFAGVLLASEFVKDALGFAAPLSGETNRTNFQFWSVLSEVNAASMLGTDPTCPCCGPARPGLKVWRLRFERLTPRP